MRTESDYISKVICFGKKAVKTPVIIFNNSCIICFNTYFHRNVNAFSTNHGL